MIDMNKKYAFEGEEGTVLTVTGSLPAFPVVWQSWTGSLKTFTCDGRYEIGRGVKLIEVKPTRWINVYPCGGYSSKEDADYNSAENRIACIEYTEGEGL